MDENKTDCLACNSGAPYRPLGCPICRPIAEAETINKIEVGFIGDTDEKGAINIGLTLDQREILIVITDQEHLARVTITAEQAKNLARTLELKAKAVVNRRIQRSAAESAKRKPKAITNIHQ